MPRYGPFHRLRSPTQTAADAALQTASSEIWGRAHRWSTIPQVQAYRGALPQGSSGIEFFTDVANDPNTVPSKPRWTGPREGVPIDGEFAKIAVVISRYAP